MGANQGDDDDNDVDRFYRCLSMSRDVDRFYRCLSMSRDVDKFYRCLPMSRDVDKFYRCLSMSRDVDRFYRCLSMSRDVDKFYRCLSMSRDVDRRRYISEADGRKPGRRRRRSSPFCSTLNTGKIRWVRLGWGMFQVCTAAGHSIAL